MSNYKLCNGCKDIKIDKHNQIYSIIKSDSYKSEHLIPIFNNKNSGTDKTHISLGKTYANCLIHYFSSQDKHQNTFEQKNVSYQNSINSGLKKLDNKGDAILHLNCPQHYIEKGKAYMSHIHILVSNKNMTEWHKKIITINVLCCINKSLVKSHLKANDRLFISALTPDDHENIAISNSFNLYYKDAIKMTPKQIQNKIKEMLDKHTKFSKYVKKNKIEFMNIPICIYCYNKDCSAGHQLANQIYRAGFTNIIDYKGGTLDWNKK